MKKLILVGLLLSSTIARAENITIKKAICIGLFPYATVEVVKNDVDPSKNKRTEAVKKPIEKYKLTYVFNDTTVDKESFFSQSIENCKALVRADNAAHLPQHGRMISVKVKLVKTDGFSLSKTSDL